MPPPSETRSPLLNCILLAFDRRHCRLSAFHDFGARSALPEQQYHFGSYGATSSAAGFEGLVGLACGTFLVLKAAVGRILAVLATFTSLAPLFTTNSSQLNALGTAATWNSI
jgi:hypothetical protein